MEKLDKKDLDKVKAIVDDAMINLVIDFSTYAQLAARLGVKVVDEDIDAPAYTDDTGIIHINAKCITKWNNDPMVEGDTGDMVNRTITQSEMQFLICHELLHTIGLTHQRAEHVGLIFDEVKASKASMETLRKWQLWNIATDYEINSLLWNNESVDPISGDARRHPIGRMPEVGCYESRYRGMTAEQIFEDLVKEEKSNNSGQLQMPEGLSEDEQNQMNIAMGGNSKDGMRIDAHLPKLDKDAENELLEKISEFFGSCANGRGLPESSLSRLLEESFKPQPFNWRKALSKYMRKFVKENYTWNKPSRAGIANNIILPSQGQGAMLNIGVAIDTSGSISEVEINAMMNHMFTILQQFKNFQIDIWACGSVVYEDTLLKITNSNKRDLKKFNAKSDGGNDMRENFDFIKKHYKGKEKIDLLIIMSDFYDPLDGDKETTSPCPVIYMCLDHKDFVKPKKINGEVYPFKVDENKN